MSNIPKDVGKPIIVIKTIMISKYVIRTTSSLRPVPRYVSSGGYHLVMGALQLPARTRLSNIV